MFWFHVPSEALMLLFVEFVKFFKNIFYWSGAFLRNTKYQSQTNL